MSRKKRNRRKPHVRQRPSGRWEIAWREGGRTIFRTLGAEVVTRADAEAASAFQKQELETRPAAAPVPGLKRLHGALDAWVEDREARGRAASTITGYKNHVRKLKALLPDVRLADVTTEMIDEYLARRQRGTAKLKKVGAATADKERVTLGSFFAWAIRRKRWLRPPSPVEAIEPLDYESEERLPCAREDLVRLLQAIHRELPRGAVKKSRRTVAHERDRRADEIHALRLFQAVLRILWATGLRVGEVCRWRDDDLRLDEEIPAVRVRAPKNKGGKRWVPIPRGLVRLFRRWAARSVALRAPVVFCTHEGKPARAALDEVRSGWNERHPTKDDAKAPGFHSLRHALATRGDEAGLDERALSRGLLGHTSRDTTARYVHRQLRPLVEAQNALKAAERAQAKKDRERRRRRTDL